MIRDAATEAQVRAARPDRSSWVVANAGSGKTRVLTDRVARLLLRGADPRRILCLTYTKAAAGEMQNRLFKRLGTWAMLPDADLRAALGVLDEGRLGISDQDLAAARTLFARALEAPGGLRIQTIHAFCEALLRRFPLEAGVTPRFEVLEARQAAQERASILDTLAEDPESGFDGLAGYLAGRDQDLEAVLAAIVQHRDRLQTSPEDPALLGAFGLDKPLPDVQATLEPAQMSALIDALAAGGGKNEQRALAGLRALRAGGNDATALLRAGFLKKDGEPLRQHMGTNAVKALLPDAADMLAQIADAIAAAQEREQAEAAWARTQALLRFAQAFLAKYDARKQALGMLEFDDMIRAARHLLTRGETADWIRYRLDGGIHHVLVDEAQDTSPAQWAVIDALTSEFFAGATDTPRTVFVVGDEKQSIYSFQGADPAAFGDQQTRYAGALTDISETLERCDLLHSFRSAPPILALVDRVFADKPGLPEAADHRAFRADLPGRVDLWPWQPPAPAPDPSPWSAPVDAPGAGDPRLVLATRIADWMADLIESGICLPGTERAIGPGDFLVLVRSRGTLFRAILSALKERGVKVAGADRLKVNDQLIVKDLLGLLSAVTTEGDDLGLAAALRSPLFGLSEAQLFALAHGRSGTLAAALEAAADRHPDAWALYADLRGSADFLRPHEMLQRILIRHQAAPRIRARLGPEAEEAVAALLDLALEYERVEPPTLTGFLDWMASGNPDVKRQLDAEAGEVRVMTVHGAKGLEAPIVILPETGKYRPPPPDPIVPLGANMATLSVPKDAGRPTALKRAEGVRLALDKAERWRLLYVAMTRAERWLVIAGAGEDPKGEDDSWYSAVAAGLEGLAPTVGSDGVATLSSGWREVPVPAAREDRQSMLPVPTWAGERAMAPPASTPPLAPSRDGAAFLPPDVSQGVAAEDPEAARLYGLHLHALLEVLPDVPPADWSAGARAALAAFDPAPMDPDTLIAEASTLLRAPDLAWIFAPGGISEAPVAGKIAALEGRAIRGQVDRLVFADDGIWIIDYKSTGQPPPDGAALPAAIAGQLALYVLALREILPDQPVRAGVLWTRAPRFTPLPHEIVTAVLQTATAT